MGSSKIKLIVFDWNGTLIADVQAMVDGVNAGLKMLGQAGITKRLYQNEFRMPVREAYIAIGLDAEIVDSKSKAIANTFHNFYEARAAKLRTRRGVRELLQFLAKHNIKAVVLSNHTKSGIEAQLKRLKIFHYFDAVLANTDRYTSTFAGKQHRLLKYLASNHFKPPECAIVGDTLEEIEIGKDLAITTIAITGGISTSRLMAAKPDYIIHNLRQIVAIVKA